MSKKVYNTAAEALEGLTFDGMTVMAGASACAAFRRTSSSPCASRA